MNDTKKISSLQLGVLTFFLSKASFFPISSSIILKYSNHNVLISLILGFIIGFIPLLIYLFINKYSNTKNIIELNNKVFGKILGNIINFIIIIGIIIMSTIILLETCNFIFSNFLNSIPQLIIALLFLLVISYAAIKGIETICRSSQIILILSALLFVIGFISLVYNIDISNFKPFLQTPMNNILKSTYYVILFGISPIFMLSIIPQDIIVKKENYRKSIIIGYIGACVFVFLTIFTTIGTLGPITNLFQYPEYIALKNIEYFHFFERVENVISIQWIFDTFIFLTISIYFLKKYMSVTFKIKKEKTNNFIVILISTLILILSNILFTNSLNFRNIIVNNYSIIMLISLRIIPLIIYLRLKFKKQN